MPLVPPGATEITAELYGIGSNGALRGLPAINSFRRGDEDRFDKWLSDVVDYETGLSLSDVEVSDLMPDVKGYLYATVRDRMTWQEVAYLRVHPSNRVIVHPAVDLSVRREDIEALGRAA